MIHTMKTFTHAYTHTHAHTQLLDVSCSLAANVLNAASVGTPFWGFDLSAFPESFAAAWRHNFAFDLFLISLVRTLYVARSLFHLRVQKRVVEPHSMLMLGLLLFLYLMFRVCYMMLDATIEQNDSVWMWVALGMVRVGSVM
jgi:hypothetical protein